MAHVLVAHADQGVRAVVAQALCEEADHDIVSTSDAALALATLWLGPRRMVALIDERLSPFNGLNILAVAANHAVSGPLSRHRYLLMSTLPHNIRAQERRLLFRLGAQVLAQPFELDTLLQMVDDAASSLVVEERPRLVQPQRDLARVASLYNSLAPRMRASMRVWV